MQLIDVARSRNFIIRLDQGDELPGTLQTALDQAEVKSAWFTGIGSLETAELGNFNSNLNLNATTQSAGARVIETRSELVSLTGNVAVQDGASSLRMSAALALTTQLGVEIVAGQLIRARVHQVELHLVSVSTDGPVGLLVRTFDAAIGLSILTTADRAQRSAAGPSQAPEMENTGPTRPRAPKRVEEDDFSPEPGERVSHFHFGECTVISSDGDRIRLRQDRDGRVREVALTMLRVEPPTIDPASGKRQFRLARKN